MKNSFTIVMEISTDTIHNTIGTTIREVTALLERSAKREFFTITKLGIEENKIGEQRNEIYASL